MPAKKSQNSRKHKMVALPEITERLLSLTLEPLEEGGYLATSADMPDLLAQGRTITETIEIAQDVARKLIESYLEHGDPLPSALTQKAKTQQPLQLNIPVAVVA